MLAWGAQIEDKCPLNRLFEGIKRGAAWGVEDSSACGFCRWHHRMKYLKFTDEIFNLPPTLVHTHCLAAWELLLCIWARGWRQTPKGHRSSLAPGKRVNNCQCAVKQRGHSSNRNLMIEEVYSHQPSHCSVNSELTRTINGPELSKATLYSDHMCFTQTTHVQYDDFSRSYGAHISTSFDISFHFLPVGSYYDQDKHLIFYLR